MTVEDLSDLIWKLKTTTDYEQIETVCDNMPVIISFLCELRALRGIFKDIRDLAVAARAQEEEKADER